jgi:hypothetical protein
MSRPFISYLFIFSLLFMGIESAVDAAGGEHPHGDQYAHSLDIDDPASLEAHDDEGHCTHCCHGHTGSIVGHITVLNCDMTHQQLAFYRPHFLNFSQAPPTPPPIV